MQTKIKMHVKYYLDKYWLTPTIFLYRNASLFFLQVDKYRDLYKRDYVYEKVT